METEPLARVVEKLGLIWREVGGRTLHGGFPIDERGALESDIEIINSAVESREKVLRDRIASLESELSKAKALTEKSVADSGTSIIEHWRKIVEDRERAAFERAKEQAKNICDSWGIAEERPTSEVVKMISEDISGLRFEEGK